MVGDVSGGSRVQAIATFIEEDLAPIGQIRFERIRPGLDAVAHGKQCLPAVLAGGRHY